MRSYTLHASLVLSGLTLSCEVNAQTVRHPVPPAPPARAFKLAAPRESVLANGLRLVVVESHAAPAVSMSLVVPAGEVYDPAGKEGLAAMTAVVLTKGTATRTAEAISASIEDVGGSLDAGAGKEFVSVNTHVASSNAALAFELLADVVMHPSFPAAEIELFRSQLVAGVQVQQSQPAAVANRIFAATLYGSHPLGRATTIASVGAITRDDIVRAHGERFKPGGSMLVVAGAITPAQAASLASKAFAKWTGKVPAAPPSSLAPAETEREIVLVNRPGSVQSAIVAGHRIEGLLGASYFPTLVSHLVLGGGGGARLNRSLRVEHGWTYGANTALTRYRTAPGMLRAMAEVRTNVTDSSVAEIIRQYDQLASTRVDTLELDLTKRRLLGSLPLQNEVASDVAASVAAFRQLDLPSTYLDSLQRGVAAVTAADVEAAAQRSMDSRRLTIVVVGDAAALEAKLRPFGRVRVVNTDGAAATSSTEARSQAVAASIDPTRILARRDSFALMAQGNAVGGVSQSIEHDAQGFRIVETAVLPGQTQRAENRLDAVGRQVSMSRDITLGGSTFETRLAYANGRVTGTVTVPTPQGPQTVKADTTIAPGTIDESAVTALVGSMPWSDGIRRTLSVYVGAAGRTFEATLAVVGKERVAVPAGNFDAWKITYTGAPQPLTVWIEAAPPHRTIRIGIEGQPVSLDLVK